MRYTYLKGRRALTQVIFIGGNIALFTIFFLVVGWLSAKLY
ncbi:MAG TPA: hypothetical protein VJA26_08480 [Gammaproteobacteria bacterium]|nr:hypothetical protein [Gammaproteobacteria bacterium]